MVVPPGTLRTGYTIGISLRDLLLVQTGKEAGNGNKLQIYRANTEAAPCSRKMMNSSVAAHTNVTFPHVLHVSSKPKQYIEHHKAERRTINSCSTTFCIQTTKSLAKCEQESHASQVRQQYEVQQMLPSGEHNSNQ